MRRSLIYILLMTLIFVAKPATGDPYVIDKVCKDAVRTYRVDGEPDLTYQWFLTDQDGNSVSTPVGVHFTDAGNTEGSEINIKWSYEPGIYILSVEKQSQYGCSTDTLGAVEVIPVPVINAGQDQSICAGNSVALSDATAVDITASGVEWTTDGDGTFDDLQAVNPVYTPGANDILAQKVTLKLTAKSLNDDGDGCFQEDEVEITINPQPVLVITDPPAVCAPQSVDLTAATVTDGSTIPPGAIFSYWRDAAATVALLDPNQVILSDTYYVKVSVNGDCGDIKPVKVLINPQPNLVITNPAEVCAPATVDLTASYITSGSDAGLVYSYWNNASASSPLANYSAIETGRTYYIKASNLVNGCASIQPVSVVINQPVIPQFNVKNVLCLNSTPPGLPTTSTDGISGTWSPATISTASFGTLPYKFTPDAGECALPTSIDVTVTDDITPLFDPIGPFCQGSVAPGLPTVSTNGITGTWNPAVISTATYGTTYYTFTPDAGQCSNPIPKPITITDPVTPTFASIGSVCQHSPDPLPSSSIEGISGTWSPAFSSAVAGATTTYTFTPNNGQCATAATLDITIEPVTDLVFAQIGTLCKGSAPPPLPATDQNGISGTWSPANISTSATGTFTYTFTADNSGGICSNPIDMNIEVTGINLAYTKVDLGFNTSPIGSIDLSVSGGSGNYTYLWTGPGGFTASSQDLANLAAGDYSVFVTDNVSGCTAPETVTITQSVNDFIVTTSFTPPLCPGSADATATVTPSGGTPPYTYKWNNGQTDSTAIGLIAGVYSVDVRDAKGLTPNGGSPIITIPETRLKYTIASAIPTDAICAGLNGKIDFVFTSFTNDFYDILYDGGQFTHIDVSGNRATVEAPPGTYNNIRVIVRGCTTPPVTVTVGAPPALAITANVTSQPNCYQPTGTVTVTSPLGINYEYIMDGVTTQASAVFNNLAPGSTHTFKARDKNTGCETDEIALSIDAMPANPDTPEVETTQPDCYIAFGAVKVTSPLGNSYQYSIDSGTYQDSPEFANLAPASSHLVRVKEIVSGCESLEKQITIDPMPLNPDAPIASITLNPTCDNPNGTVQITSPAEGTGFEYSINGGSYLSTATFTGLITKWYTFRVRNIITGCESDTAGISVPAIPPSPTLAATASNCACYGDNGRISFKFTHVDDGTYVITHDKGQFSAVNVKNDTASVIVPAGTYSNLTIDANGCTAMAGTNVTVTQPAPISINASITEIDFKSNTKGSIDLFVTGGSGIYSYNWYPDASIGYAGATTKDISDLGKGTYRVTITDANGCAKDTIITIPPPNYPPIAMNDLFETGCGALSGNLLADNGSGKDYDPENDSIFFNPVLVRNPAHGTITFNPDNSGAFEYVADLGYSGVDTFRYVITDIKQNVSNAALVTINIIADFDGDGIPDDLDADADGDGILNVDEAMPGQDWKTADNDGDGHPNWLDIDSDNDGIVDNIEAQSTPDYIPPSGKDTNGNGVDDAYDTATGGIHIVPVDTDGDGIPDFLDVDSDNDHVPDYIEGNDANRDGKPDFIATGKDSDGDGLDDAYDIVDRCASPSGNMLGSQSPIQDTDGDGMRDFRDINDDNDKYLTMYEDLNGDGDFSNDDTNHNGIPEYLDPYRDCDLLVPEAFSPNGDNIHDYFQVYCMDNYPNARMYIFDALGNKLFEKAHYGNIDFWGSFDRAWWDGKTTNRSAVTNNGKVIPGTYYYVLQLGNGEVKKSYVFVSY